MNALLTFVVVIQVLAALTIIALVLLQHGKGADMGAAFGSGASGSLFGASGSSNFLSKSTGIAAAIFFCATLALAFMGSRTTGENIGVMENLPAATVPAPDAQIPGAEQAAPVVPNSQPAPANNAGADVPAANSAGQANQIPK